jgi:tagatose 1,6-diphosphate aldolase
VADSFTWFNPGPLQDGDLQLVAPCESFLDQMLAALDHPLTRQEMPWLPAHSRHNWLETLANEPEGRNPGDESTGIAPAYYFWMLRAAPPAGERFVVGTINLRIGHSPNLEQYAGQIGYDVFPFARGRHYAERSCRLLLPLARRHGLNPLWITCNPDNTASRRTLERLGAKLIEIVPIPADHRLYALGERNKCRYRVDL